MTWVKLDDQFPDHPKVEAAGPMAAWLYVCGLCYCAEHLTDGFIPASKAARLAPVPAKHLERLCQVGLWTKVDDGYRVHDYLDFQPSGETVRRERKAASERMANKRGRSGDVRAKFDESSSSPSPSPSVPNGTPERRAQQSSQLRDGWMPSERALLWANSTFPNVNWPAETEKFRDHHLAKGSRFKDWDRAWQKWIRQADEWRVSRPGQESVGDRNIRLLRGELA